jgi:hypothetical protein
MTQPQLAFFCELKPEPLAKLFDGRFVIDNLKALNATLSLGILDHSKTRTELVKRLNKAGVPVVAWLLLPEEEGYWFNIDNHTKAAACYEVFKAWTDEHGLEWAGVGLDIELDINEARAFFKSVDRWGFLTRTLKRFADKKRIIRAQLGYQTLVNRIRVDGYTVKSYQFPFIIDERRAQSSVLQRALGLVDLNTDHEVLMLYSSFFRPQGDAILWSYAPEADSVGVGVTGGGVDLTSELQTEPLSWEEFTRDLRLCVMHGKPIHIFSLEGCVAQNFLTRLNTFDWDQTPPIPGNVNRVRSLRTAFTALLWMLERPWIILLSLATLIGLGFLFKRTEPAQDKK